MIANTYGNPWKYMETCSKKAFKAFTRSERHQHQFQITKITPKS